MVLLQNPTVDEIANAINADDGDDGEKAIDMDPIFGLRTLMCLFIVRAHFARHFGALCDTQYPDTWHGWHTSVFFFLGGMQMQMQYEREAVPTKRLLINFLISFMPSYWVISIGAAAVACQPLGWVGFLFGTLTLHFPFFVGAMGPAWYAWNMLYFVLSFNMVRSVVSRARAVHFTV